MANSRFVNECNRVLRKGFTSPSDNEYLEQVLRSELKKAWEDILGMRLDRRDNVEKLNEEARAKIVQFS